MYLSTPPSAHTQLSQLIKKDLKETNGIAEDSAKRKDWNHKFAT